MRSTKRSPKRIDEYLASVNANHRDALQKIREAIHAVAPNAEECISYGIPAFRLNGRALVFFGAGAHHCAVALTSAASVRKMRAREGVTLLWGAAECVQC